MPGLAGFLVLASCILSGCNRSDQDIKVYRLAKPAGDSPPPEFVSQPVHNHESVSMTENAVPPNWEPQPLSQMRQASFLVHGENGATVDISFVTLGPAAGNVLDNVNRWLGQLSQPSITNAELAALIQELALPNGNVQVVDLSGEPENGDAKKDGRIIAAIAPSSGGTAFYKMRGNVALVGAEKEHFLEWVSSFRDSSGLKDGMTTAQVSNNSTVPQINWEVPGDWSAGSPSPMRYASFVIEKNNEKAEVSVVTFPGDGGSDLENVNRWRQQVGLTAVDPGALKSMVAEIPNTTLGFSNIDLAGPTSRTIAAWTRHGGRAWFFKLSGPTEAVEREKTNFVKFIQSVRL